MRGALEQRQGSLVSNPNMMSELSSDSEQTLSQNSVPNIYLTDSENDSTKDSLKNSIENLGIIDPNMIQILNEVPRPRILVHSDICQMLNDIEDMNLKNAIDVHYS